MTASGAATPHRRLYLAALIAAFGLRVAAGCVINVDASGVHRGFDFYGFMADHVLDGRGLVWAFYDDLGDKWANRAPLYPLLVAAVRFVAGRASAVPVVVAQAALGAAACLVPAAFAARWGGTRAALVAVWIAALWPYSLAADTSLVEHVAYAPLAGLAVLATLRAADRPGVRGQVAAGVVAGLATLARLTFASGTVLLAAVSALRGPRWPRVALFAAGTAAVLVPWMMRNHGVTGAWTLGTDGGRALWVGNAEETFRRYPAESIDEAERDLFAKFTPADWQELRAQNGDEVAQERIFLRRAVTAAARRPAATAWGGLRKAAALWSPVMNPGPTPAGKLLLFGVPLALVLGGALAAAARVARMRADLPAILAVAASFTIVAAVFWGQSRYLAPLHQFAIAAAAAWLAARPSRWRTAP
jgi:hypothetical protein